MKVQIDTQLKTVVIEESVEIGKLFDVLKAMLGEDWKKWKLESRQITNWTSPIVIREYPTYPLYPKIWWGTSPVLNDPHLYVQCSGKEVANYDVQF